MVVVILFYLTGDKFGFVAQLLTAVNNRPTRVDMKLCFARGGRRLLDHQWGRYDRLRRDLGLGLEMSLGRGQAVDEPAHRQLDLIDVFVLLETLDEVHRLRVCVEDDTRLRVGVSHHVPSATELHTLRSVYTVRV